MAWRIWRGERGAQRGTTRLHPLAVILVLAVGGVLRGIPGAVVAVPAAAAITRARPELRRRPDPGDEPRGDEHTPI
jgi:predicted PurR-regulated permease PerM